MKLMSLFAVVASMLMGLAGTAAPTSNQWEQPAASLAEEIAGILGPGQARLTIRNFSTISNDEIPEIRRLMVQDLKARGVVASGAESANIIRLTLSENARKRLWVAEVIQGNETRVAMVHMDPGPTQARAGEERMVLRKERFWASSDSEPHSPQAPTEPILALMETRGGLVVLFPGEISVFTKTEPEMRFKRQSSFDMGARHAMARDPRGILLPSPDGNSFTAFTPGTQCVGTLSPAAGVGNTGEWTIRCSESDDPWTILQNSAADPSAAPPAFKAFYNAARNYFTGVVTPSLDVELPPFYSAAMLSRPAAAVAMLINGIDSKVQLAENAVLKPVSGTRDWGSDFATLHSGCGSGTQIVAAGSGEAIADSLRAYELPAQEAVAASAPLAMDGTVTAMWSAADGKSIFAVVRGPQNQYEVDRVTALCN